MNAYLQFYFEFNMVEGGLARNNSRIGSIISSFDALRFLIDPE